jgi:hypothetical protein
MHLGEWLSRATVAYGALHFVHDALLDTPHLFATVHRKSRSSRRRASMAAKPSPKICGKAESEHTPLLFR